MKRIRKCIITRYLVGSNEIEAEYQHRRMRVPYPLKYPNFEQGHTIVARTFCVKLGWGKRRPIGSWCYAIKGFIFIVSVPAKSKRSGR